MSPTTVISAFSPEHVAQITGLSLRQLALWDRLGFFKPSLRQTGFGKHPLRVYSFQDVVGLRVIAVLRNQHGVSLQQLRKAAAELQKHSKTPWASLKLTVSQGEVGFVEPGTNRGRGALTGQYILMPLIEQIRHVRRAAAELNRRTKDEIGAAERRRNIAHNARVFSGTRIPVRAVERFLAAGYSPDAILKEYPSLSLADIEMVQKELRRSVAA